jgi:hypothetical protein
MTPPKVLVLFIAISMSVNTLNAYRPGFHSELTDNAIKGLQPAVRKALEERVDLKRLRRAVEDVDDSLTNDDKHQNLHSMRTRGQSLADARQLAGELSGKELDAAVGDARAGLSPTAVADHLARAIHAVQDEKHHWTSCNPDTNGKASQDTCYTTGQTCTDGSGNHGLGPNCEIQTNITLRNFQNWSDLHPSSDPAAWNTALQKTTTLMKSFVARTATTP